MEKERKNIGIVVLIVVLIMVILGLCTFIMYDKGVFGSQKGNNPKTNNEEKVNENDNKFIEVSVDDAVVQKLFYRLIENSICGNFQYFKDAKFSVNDISNSDAYYITMRSWNTNFRNSFSAAELDAQIDKIFGKSYEFKHQTYGICLGFENHTGIQTYEYNASNQMYEYVFIGDGCGGTCGMYHTTGKIVKAEKNAEELDIYVRVIFGNSEDALCADYNCSQKIEVNEDTLGYSAETRSFEKLDYSKGSLYKMIFKMENGEYVFVSSEPINK